MTDISGELLNSIHSAGACLIDIRELAGKLVRLSAGQMEAQGSLRGAHLVSA